MSRARTTTRTLEPSVRKAQILAAARSLLVEKGYGDLLLDDVARRAGVAKGTLYLHFSDKRDLFSAVMAGIIEGLEQRVREAAAQSGDPLARLTRVVSEILQYVDANKDFFLLVGPASPKQRSPALKRRFDSYLAALGEVLAPAMDAGRLRRRDLETAAMMVIAFSRMFMMRKVFLGRSEPLKACTDEMMDLMLNGLGAGERR